MKKQLLLLLAGLAFTLSGIAQWNKNSQPYLTKPFDGAAIQAVAASTSGGNLMITGAAETKVEVYVQSSAKLSQEEIKKQLDDHYTLTIAIQNGKLVAEARVKDRDRGKSLSIGFKIFVPENVSISLSTSGGNIRMEHLKGTQDIKTSGGNLDMSNVTGTIKGSTSGGNIRMENCSKDIDLKTSGGNVMASRCDGNIHLSTGGGHVEGQTITGELAVFTSGGNIQLEALACSLETATSGGSIEAAFSKLGQYVRIQNSGGNVRLTLPSGEGLTLDLYADKIKTSSLYHFDGDTQKHFIKGNINGGGIPVHVDAGKGSLTLSWK